MAVGKKGSKNPLREMKGQMGVGLVFLFLGGLALSGFALDSGVVFLRRSQLQKILDSAALNGVAAAVNGKSQAEVKTWAQRFVQHQARNRGIDVIGNASVSVKVPRRRSPETRVQVSIRANCNYLMGKFLSTFSAGAQQGSVFNYLARAAATTQRRPVILSMVFDVSGSMAAPAGRVEGSKLAVAKAAAKELVDILTCPDDQIALIPYGNYTQVAYAMNIVAGNVDAIKNAVDALWLNGATNIAQGILYGKQQIEAVEASLDPSIGYRRMILLFTDGCPNTVLTQFPFPRPSAVSALPPFDPDAMYWSNTNRGSFDHPPQMFRLQGVSGLEPACSAGAGSASANQCLEKWAYLDSNGARMGLEQALTLGSPTQAEIDFLKHMPQDLAIREADYAKDLYPEPKQVTIYTVGLGATTVPNMVDPYESEKDQSTLRTILLREIANDPTYASYPQFPPEVSHPAAAANQAVGRFYPVPDPRDLAQAFKDIINADLKTIKLTDYVI